LTEGDGKVVAATFGDAEDGTKLGFVDQKTLVRDAGIVGGRVANGVHEALGGGKAGEGALGVQVGVNLGKKAAGVGVGGAFPAGGGGTDADGKEVEVMGGPIGDVMSGTAEEGPEHDEIMCEEGDGVGLRLGLDAVNELTS
jgi:hypothetical protein